MSHAVFEFHARMGEEPSSHLITLKSLIFPIKNSMDDDYYDVFSINHKIQRRLSKFDIDKLDLVMSNTMNIV